MIVVSDTSPITSLIQVEALPLLSSLYGGVLIPEAVYRELAHSHQILPDFIQMRAALDRATVDRLSIGLDLGEAEAIVLAKEAAARLLLIDEKLGRQAAVREGLAITGLMGVLIAAKRRNLIPSLREVVAKLEIRAGFRVSEAVKREAFHEAGE